MKTSLITIKDIHRVMSMKIEEIISIVSTSDSIKYEAKNIFDFLKRNLSESLFNCLKDEFTYEYEEFDIYECINCKDNRCQIKIHKSKIFDMDTVISCIHNPKDVTNWRPKERNTE